MAEEMTDKEYQLLCDALDDGFPDMLGRRNDANRADHGSIFATNPLGQEVTFFMPYEGAPSGFSEEIRSRFSESDGGIYAEADTLMEYFALSPFGFNLSKLEAFFDARVSNYKEMLHRKYQKYLEAAEPIPYEDLVDEPSFPDVFDGVYSYRQWLENILVPYSKIWFEHEISDLINKIVHVEGRLCEEPSAPVGSMGEFWREQNTKDHFLLGRLVEHYKWKFKHESALVKRKSQFELAGSGGGKASQAKRNERLDAFMSQIEVLADLAGKIDEDRILAQAWDDAGRLRDDMPKTPKVRFDYEVELRSIEPFKTRYEAVFRKSA